MIRYTINYMKRRVAAAITTIIFAAVGTAIARANEAEIMMNYLNASAKVFELAPQYKEAKAEYDRAKAEYDRIKKSYTFKEDLIYELKANNLQNEYKESLANFRASKAQYDSQMSQYKVAQQ